MYVKRLDGTFRYGGLDAYVFETLDEVRELTHKWIEEFNRERPLDLLGDLTLEGYLANIQARSFYFRIGLLKGIRQPVTMRLLCVYTCERDREYLNRLKQTPLYAYLKQDSRYRIIEVYSDPRLAAPHFTGDQLYVACPEQYTSLSIKTHLMVTACMSIEFDTLLKLDSTIVGYGAKPQRKRANMLAALTPRAVRAAIEQDSFFEPDYNGLIKQRVSERNFAQWMHTKNIACDYRQVFRSGQNTPEYFIGKFYTLSRRFCRYIADNGRPMALEHERHLGGSEDLMIGRLHQQSISGPR